MFLNILIKTHESSCNAKKLNHGLKVWRSNTEGGLMFLEDFAAMFKQEVAFLVQYNLNGSNPDGSFTVDDSNSFFQSLQNPSNSSRKQIFRDFFLILSWNCLLCVLIRIASSRRF